MVNYTAIIIAILCMLTVVALVKMFINKSVQQQALENGKTVKGIVLPLRLQAYERMALYLERIEPSQLVMRIHSNGLTVAQEQNLLLTSIRGELEHNLSQQIYISNEVWKCINDAKDDIVDIINAVAAQYEPTADSLEFAQAVIAAAAEKPVVAQAMLLLKSDVQRLY